MTGRASHSRASTETSLGTTGIRTSAVIAGGSPLAGGMEWAYGSDLSHAAAVDLVEAIMRSPIRAIDTSNVYGDGAGETRIGDAVRRLGGLPDGFSVFTKVDAKNGDFSADRVRTSIAESQERLGLSAFPLVFLHDPEYGSPFEEKAGPGGAVEGLLSLKADGIVSQIGLAGGDSREMRKYLDLGIFDAFLTHSRYSLVDRSADALIDLARAAGLGVLNAAVFGGGLLTRPNAPGMYGYREAHPAVIESVRRMDAACRAHGIELGTAALQFSLRDPRVDCTVVGFSRPERIEATLKAADVQIPESLWLELDSLLPPAEAWLDAT